ncbi:MAG TPA: hypothetical protein VJ783_12155 [Pirellulales bacterium]|nr:hypothetical protein [Pirellulales bacterium]
MSSAGHAPVVPAPRQEQNFDEAIREFISMVDELGITRPSDEELCDLCSRVAELSLEFFPGDLVVKAERDWEIPDDIYFVFRVIATGSVDDIVARSNQWHIQVRRAVSSRAELFCLSFDVRE